MLTAIKDIGDIILKQENKDPVDIIVENPAAEKVLSIVFDNNFNYQKVELSDFDKNRVWIYLYRRGSSNGADITPTSRTGKNIDDILEKTLKKKIFAWFKNHHDKKDLFSKIYSSLKSNEDKIKQDIAQQLKNVNLNKTSLLITIKVDTKYIGEIEEFKNFMVDYFLSEKVKLSSSKNKVCSICGELKEEVFTTSEIYKFYNLDKECYISSGFKKENAWKNFPICKECFLKLETGKKIIEENLIFKFSGLNYYLIPKVLINPENKAVLTIIEILKRSKDRESFTENEDLILTYISEYNDFITLYFLFLKKDNQAERIQLLIEDVMPSRIRKIVNTEEKIRKLFGDFNFNLISKFFKDDTNKLLFEIADAIFRGGKLDRLLLYRKILASLNSNLHENKKSFIEKIKNSLSVIRFFEELGLLHYGGDNMNEDKFGEIYEKFKGLDTPAKRGIFLLGALTQWLLSLQAYERDGSTPFVKNLKGLNMNIQDIKGLLPKISDKFIAYDNHTQSVRELEKEISKNLLLEPNPKLSIEEINFIFATGMALYDEVKSKLKEEDKNG
jgi:CRISPR-associated protein Csh1